MKKNLILRWAVLILLISCCTPLKIAAQTGGTSPQTASPSSATPATNADSEKLNARLTAVEQAAADAKSSADNAWMLTSAALVLMMTGPGLALFYGGLVRKKNVLGTMVQSFAMMAVVTVVWAIVGDSLAFGAGNSF